MGKYTPQQTLPFESRGGRVKANKQKSKFFLNFFKKIKLRQMKKVTNGFCKGITAISLLLMCCVSSMTIRAQTTVTITGGGTIACPAVPPVTYSGVPTGITFSTWSRGSAVTCVSAANGLSGSGFNTASYSASFSAIKYYSITISADAATTFTLNQVVWIAQSSAGTPNFTVEYSNNGGPITALGTTAQTTTTSTFNGSVSVSAGTSIVLYFIPANTPAAATTVRLVTNSTITLTATTPPSGGPYTWIPTSGSADFQTSTNWSPTRTTPVSSDVLNFTNGGTVTSTNVPSQTIGQLFVANNTNVTFKDVASDVTTSTLGISGGTGTDFSVANGSSVTFDVASSNNADGMAISLGAGTSGTLDGVLNFVNTNATPISPNHRLLVSDAGSFIVGATGSVIAKNLNSNPFGSGGTDGVIIFTSGSVYEAQAGGNPFGTGAKITFNTGSKYRHKWNGIPSLASRVYADFEFAYAGTVDYSSGSTLGAITYIDNLTVLSGGIFNLTVVTAGTINIQLKNNLTVGGTLNYSPNLASTFTFQGTSQQTVNGAGTLTLGSNLNVIVNNAAGVLLNRNLTVGGTLTSTLGDLSINGNTLTLNGPVTRTSGSITGSQTSNLTIGGTAGSLYFTSGGFNNYLKDLMVTGSATLATDLNITAGSSFGTVTVTGSLNANGFLAFKSDANGTARIGVSTANSITGAATLESYMSARRAWRLLAVPTTGQTINAAWQEGSTNPTIWPNSNPNPGFGTHITFTTGAPGYDVGPEQNASIKKWNLNNGWSSLPSTLVPLSNELGYFLFVRGPRSTDLRLAVNAPTAPTVLRSKGTVKTGPVSIGVSSLVSGGYVLIPNQYVSSLNLTSAINSPNMNPNEYARWDHGIGGTYGVGGWVNVLSGTVSNPTTRFPNATATSNVQIGESFIGKLATGAMSATISYAESDKLSTEFLVFRPKPQTTPEVHVQLFIITDSTISNADGTAVQFGIFTSKHALKFTNTGENIFVQNDSVGYAIESKEPLKGPDSSLLRLSKLKVGQRYSLIVGVNDPFIKGMKAYLVDRYTGSVVVAPDAYDFVADSATYKTRFVVRYQLIRKEHGPKDLHHNAVSVYPNPTRGSIHINDVPDGLVKVIDLSGHATRYVSIHDGTIDCSFLTPGAYYLQLKDRRIISFTKL